MTVRTYRKVSAEQARLLKQADAICFDSTFRPDGDHSFGIRALIRANDHTGEGERTIPIPVDIAALERYHQQSGEQHRTFHCFDMIMSARYDSPTRTWVSRVKAGSVISLKWVRSNQSPLLDDAGLVCDELYLSIERHRDDGQGGFTRISDGVYRVAKRITRDDSARMVRIS